MEIDCPGNRPILPIERACWIPRSRYAAGAQALQRADKILIGPGDLYTSVVPCLLIEGVRDAVQASDGEVIYICNVMTKRGETDGYRASDFVRTVHRYLGRRVDAVIVNTAAPTAELMDATRRKARHGRARSRGGARVGSPAAGGAVRDHGAPDAP